MPVNPGLRANAKRLVAACWSAAFLDGFLLGIDEARATKARSIVLTENYEDYFLRTRADFQRTFTLARHSVTPKRLVSLREQSIRILETEHWGPQAAALSRQPSLFRQHYRVGFGLSLDQNNAGGTVTSVWDTKNFS